MPWVDGTGHIRVDELTVGAYALQESLKLRVHEVTAQLLHALVDLLREHRIIDDGTDARAHIDKDHHDAVALQLHLRLKLRLQETRSVEEALSILKDLQGAPGTALVARRDGILGERYGSKGLAEHITALAQRLAVLGNREVHVAVLVETVFLKEVDGALRRVEPFLTMLHIVVSKGADKSEATLKPHALRGVHQ